jgi:hypothetical protein
MFGKVYILHTIYTEPQYSLYRAAFFRGNYLVLQQTECRATALVGRVKNKVHILEGVFENFENVQGLPCLFILDDLLNEMYSRAVYV